MIGFVLAILLFILAYAGGADYYSIFVAPPVIVSWYQRASQVDIAPTYDSSLLYPAGMDRALFVAGRVPVIGRVRITPRQLFCALVYAATVLTVAVMFQPVAVLMLVGVYYYLREV